MHAHLTQAFKKEQTAGAQSQPALSSLRAFLAAALRPRTPLARAIVAVLSVKLVAVTAMAVYFHFASQHVAANAAAIGRLLGPSTLP